jgi:hypothetical protein
MSAGRGLAVCMACRFLSCRPCPGKRTPTDFGPGGIVRKVAFGTILLLGLLIIGSAPALQDASRTFLPVVHHQPTPTATLTPTPAPTPTRSTPYDLRITNLKYTGRDEYVQISNYEPSTSVEMTGWTIKKMDSDRLPYSFPYAFVLATGAYVRVHSGLDAFENRPTDLQWTRAYVWTDSGGVAQLVDPQGRVVSVWGY